MLQELRNTSNLPVQGTFYTHRALSHDMSVEHRRSHIGVTEQFLDGANIGARLEQVGGKAMTKGMTTRRL